MIKLRNLVAHKIWDLSKRFGCRYSKHVFSTTKTRSLPYFLQGYPFRKISLSLQFGSFNPEQLLELSKSKLPNEISAINSEIFDGLTEAQKQDQAFQFSVVYTKVASSVAKAAYKFVTPESAEGKALNDVLVKIKPGSETHPYKPSDVAALVSKATGKKFTVSDHTVFWKKYKVRPATNAADQTKTKIQFCFYNPVFNCHCYNEEWVNKLIAELGVSP